MSQSSFVCVDRLEAFFGEPARRYVVFRSFAYWQLEERVFGTIIWGRPNEADVAQMCLAHETGAHCRFRGHASLVDIRALEAVDVLAFEKLGAYLHLRRGDWSPNVSQQVVLHQGGYAHAVVAGMFQFLRLSHPVAFCNEPEQAFNSIGALDAQAELEILRRTLLGVPEIIRRLRSALVGLPPGATLESVAHALGTSTRSLQRSLAACGTSLRSERQRRVLLESERLLEGTDLDLASIASISGASSPSHLITIFREHHGTTPGEFRSRLRHPPRLPSSG